MYPTSYRRIWAIARIVLALLYRSLTPFCLYQYKTTYAVDAMQSKSQQLD